MTRNHNQRGHNQAHHNRNWAQEFNTDWIAKRIDREGIKYSEDFGQFLVSNSLTTSQIRNIFGEVKRIQMSGITKPENQTAFLLLKPKMAYAVKRDGKRGLEELTKVLNKAFDTVDTDTSDKEQLEKQYKNFVDFFEALLAYHKAFGGK